MLPKKKKKIYVKIMNNTIKRKKKKLQTSGAFTNLLSLIGPRFNTKSVQKNIHGKFHQSITK